MFLRGLDHPLEEFHIDDFRSRVVREADDQHLWFLPSQPNRFFEMTEENLAGGQRNAAQVAAGENDRVLMDRISRARTKHYIAGIDGRPGKMRQTFLGADGDDRFRVRIEIDPIALLV